MTIFSAQLKFSNDQAITADALSTNVIDLGAPGTPKGSSVALGQDIGPGESIPIVANVTEDFATNTDLTVQVRVSDNSDMSSADIVAQSAAIPVAELLAGTQIKFPDRVPHGTNKRYMSLYYLVGGTDATTGKITAGIVTGRQTNG